MLAERCASVLIGIHPLQEIRAEKVCVLTVIDQGTLYANGIQLPEEGGFNQKINLER